MKNNGNCKTGVLAESEFCRVDYCTCGLVHIHFGGFSMRLERDALPVLGATIDAAVAQILSMREPTIPNLRLVHAVD